MLWKNPRHIQRLSPPTGRDPALGAVHGRDGLTADQIDALKGLFHFEYMGAAEYEWEQVPDAIQRIADHLPDFIKGSYREFGRKEIWYLVHRSCEDAMFQWIRNHLLWGNLNPNVTQESTSMDLATSTVDPKSDILTTGWLALGACPWLATTNKEAIASFTDVVRKHFAVDLAQKT